MSKKLTDREYINELKKIDVNKLINFDTLKLNGNEIEYKCNKCGETHLYQKRGQVLKGYICYRCDGKLEEFLNLASSKCNKRFSYITDYDDKKYLGTTITRIDSENCKIGVVCNKHKEIFQTKIKSFLNGEELCPICKYENSNFKSKIKKDNFILYKSFNDIYVHKNCTDEKIIDSIISFLCKNTSYDNFWAHDIFIDENYYINVHIRCLNDLNKEWRGFNIYILDGELPNNIKFGEVVSSSFNVYSGFFNFDEQKYNVNYINNLIGCPKIIYGNFNCNNVKLKSLECGPNIVYGNMSIKNNDIKNLIGCPKIIYGDFIISNNKIPSVECFDNVECEVFGKLNRKNNLFIE